MEVRDFRLDNAIAHYKGLSHQDKAIALFNDAIATKGELNQADFEQFVMQWRTPDPSISSTAMQISQRGIDLIKEFEGCELSAYPDPGTGGDPWTIGYGHTGSDVYPGMSITIAQAEDLLRQDLRYFEQGVIDLVMVPLTQNQFDALVSFAYNTGLGALGESTLLSVLNEGDYQGAVEQFARWVNGANGVLPGLVRRREAEAQLFLG
jgi:lysozyme